MFGVWCSEIGVWERSIIVPPRASSRYAEISYFNDDDPKEFVALQKKHADSPKSWTIDAKTIDPTTFDLSVKNPDGGEEVKHRSPEAILDEIAKLDQESANVLQTIRELL
ncbi:MAG: hypothetical protein WEB58_15355 [Planctomycetaceae bacterium]